jgi:two-component system response regulator AlgR
MRLLIVDDEAPARSRLRQLAESIPGCTVVADAGNGREAVEVAARTAVDCVLLDIAMPGVDGLEAARHLATLDRPPAVVFCTAHDAHALEAFEARAIDYLLKPVRRERLEIALERARRLHPDTVRELADAVQPRQARTHLCAKVRGNLKLVPITEVTHLLAEDKYVVAHHAGGELLIEEPLKDLELEFGDRFLRIHRNCLVAADRITALTRASDGRMLVAIRGTGAMVEVSRRSLPALRRRLRNL